MITYLNKAQKLQERFIKYVKTPPLKAEAIIEIIVIQSIINI